MLKVQRNSLLLIHAPFSNSLFQKLKPIRVKLWPKIFSSEGGFPDSKPPFQARIQTTTQNSVRLSIMINKINTNPFI